MQSLYSFSNSAGSSFLHCGCVTDLCVLCGNIVSRLCDTSDITDIYSEASDIMEDLPPLPEVEDDPSNKWFNAEDEYDENNYSICAVPGLTFRKLKITFLLTRLFNITN